MAFPNENATLTGKDGQSISLASAMMQSTYATWDFNNVTFATLYHWSITEGFSFPSIVPTTYGKPCSVIFPDQNKSLEGKDGLDISDADAQKRDTYAASGWSLGPDDGDWKYPVIMNIEGTLYWIIGKPTPTSFTHILVSTSAGVLELDVRDAEVVLGYSSCVKMVLGDGKWYYAYIVELDDTVASPVRIETPSGIKSWARRLN
jgi:hypothetical protein